jgi:hypothetical protein
MTIYALLYTLKRDFCAEILFFLSKHIPYFYIYKHFKNNFLYKIFILIYR